MAGHHCKLMLHKWLGQRPLCFVVQASMPTTTKHHLQAGLTQCESGLHHNYYAADKVTSSMLCTMHACNHTYMHACR